ncbi:TPA: hypothetical protein KIA93_000327 [Salmonella enterica]|uniref:hypothetical protein n=1 Tax=Salmonella enterica TaxID=28901 RepID=UPI0009B009E1|nr:hypothetical protein [Salmonella enterica]HBD1844121.1 hypothetical protein [Salmonella enterica]
MSQHNGKLAKEVCGLDLPLQILHSAGGYYIGTFNNELGPVSRESQEYYPSFERAQQALEMGTWTQRENA